MKFFRLFFLLVILSGSSLAQKNVYNELLLDTFSVIKFKDSLQQEGWLYQDKFPFFKKTATTGSAPKSCSFSPDGKYIYVTLLNQKGKGVQVFEISTMKRIKTITPKTKDPEKNIGYPEGVFNMKDSSFWFTRMTTGDFFVYSHDTIEEHDAHGVWTKIIEFNPGYEKVIVSHWVSSTVSVFDVETRKHLRTIKTGKTPRGIVWINDSIVAVALFAKGDVQIFNTETGTLLHTIEGTGGAMRDIHYDEDKQILYFNDMRTAKVYKYSWKDKKMLASVKVDSHPNSLRLTPDKKYIIISCRGPNNPKGYTLRSPRNGILSLIRAEDLMIIKSWEGGNQPTGIDISHDGKYLATTDFQDAKLNLFIISK